MVTLTIKTILKDIVNRLTAIKAPVSEDDQLVTPLGSMQSEYETVAIALETQKPETVTLEFIQSALLNEEQERNVPTSSGKYQ